ncbi:hypothetical protein D8911_04535 [Levilactobacillus brevis]|nr:hypothetical protein D8911_04535 [Levilactobacillus brevis]
MGRNAVGGRVEPRIGLDASPLSRRSRLKDASFLSGMNRAAKETPTAEPIFGGLSATDVLANNNRFNPWLTQAPGFTDLGGQNTVVPELTC